MFQPMSPPPYAKDRARKSRVTFNVEDVDREDTSANSGESQLETEKLFKVSHSRLSTKSVTQL